MTSSEPAPPADPTHYRRKGFGFAFWAAMAFSLVCLIGGIFVGFFWDKVMGAPGDEPSAASSPAQLSSADPVDSAVATPAGAEKGAPAAPPAADSANLSARIQRLEAGQAQLADSASMALATAALLQASQTSGPFRQELASVETLLPADPNLIQLRNLAASGAPTRPLLAADFADYASRAIAASRKPEGDASLLDRVRYAIAAVITIRRIDHTEGSGVNAILARAENKVHDGDVEGALVELDTLPPAPREAVRGWTDSARRRVEIDRRIADMRDTSLRALSMSTRS